MIPPLATALLVASLAGALVSLVLLFLSRPVGQRVLLGALGLVELGMAVQAMLGIVNLAHAQRHIQGVVFVCYLIGALLILPAAGWWSLAERSRWGMGVLLIACLVVPVMIVRMNQIWAGTGA